MLAELPFAPARAEYAWVARRRNYASKSIGVAQQGRTQAGLWQGSLSWASFASDEQTRLWRAFMLRIQPHMLQDADGLDDVGDLTRERQAFWAPLYAPHRLQAAQWHLARPIIATHVLPSQTGRLYAMQDATFGPPVGAAVEIRLADSPAAVVMDGGTQVSIVGSEGRLVQASTLIQVAAADNLLVEMNWDAPRVRAIAVNADLEGYVQASRYEAEGAEISWIEDAGWLAERQAKWASTRAGDTIGAGTDSLSGAGGLDLAA